MAKLKVKFNNQEILVEGKISKEEQLNFNDINILRSKNIRGIMKPTIESDKKISYIAPSGVNLIQYLSSPITKGDFFFIFVQVLEVIKSVEKNNFNVRNIVLDLNYSYINEKTKELHMIYQPIFTNERSAGLAAFIYNLGYCANIATQQDYNDMNALVTYALNDNRISIQKIEQHIKQIYPQVYVRFNSTKPVQSQMLKGDDIYYKQDNANKKPDVMNFENTQQATINSSVFDDGSEGTTLLSEGAEETTVLSQQNAKSAFLTRSSNNEKVSINKPAFRVGKEKSYVDYFVQNNSAVSRIHADIIIENDRYFIKDNNSTNGTFVNGVAIPTVQNVEIFNGDAIILANEKFDFSIE